MAELAAATGMSMTTLRHHVRWMAARGELELRAATRQVIRHEIVLTEGGGR